MRDPREKAKAQVKDTLSFVGELIFGEDPEETLKKRIDERGDETSPVVKSAAREVARSVGAEEVVEEERPAPRRELRGRDDEPVPDCAACRVARRCGGLRCVEHS